MQTYGIERSSNSCQSCGAPVSGDKCDHCGREYDVASTIIPGNEQSIRLEDALLVIERILAELEDRADSYHYPHLRERKFDELHFELKEAHKLRNEVARWSIIFIAAVGALGSFSFPIINQAEGWLTNQNSDEAVFWLSIVLCVILTMTAAMMTLDASVGGNAIADTLFQDEKKVVIDDATDAALRQESRSRAISNINHNALLRVFDFWQRFHSALGDEHKDIVEKVAQILDINTGRLIDAGQIQDIARMKKWCEGVLGE